MSEHRLVKGVGPFIILLLCVFVAYQITQSKPSATKGNFKQAKPLLVAVKTISPERFQVKVESYAALRANTQTEILPLVSGQVIKVSAIFKSGAFVRSGQVLLEIDPLEYEVALQVAQGDLADAELALAEEEARSEQAYRDWQGQKKTAGNEVSDFALRYPQLKAANAKLETAKAKLKLAKEDLKRTKVRAPYDGRLIDTFVNIGSVVSTGTSLAELYSSESLELSLPIANRDLAFLNLPFVGESEETSMQVPVRVENALAVPSEYWKAAITGTEALVDAENQQIYALAKIVGPLYPEDSPQELKVGQYLHASIDGKMIDNALMVPNTSIYQGSYVYLVENRAGVDVLSRRDIEVSWRNEVLSLIKSGLNDGDQLVTTPLGQVTSGTRVRIEAKTEEETQENRS